MYFNRARYYDPHTTITGTTNTDYTYDNNGNLKSDGTKSYTYDYNNRLVQVTQSGTTIAQYQYDILGRRIQKVTPTEAITYVYAGDNVIQEIRTLGGGTNNPLTLKKTYINGLGTDNLIAYDNEESTNQDKISFCQTRVLPYSTEFQSYGYQSIIDDCTTTMSSSTGITTNRYYYHTNHLGSIIALTNNSGNMVQTYSYDSFGKPYIVNGSGTGITPLDSYTGTLYSNTRLYTGREYDRELQLYYLRARYYNPDTGRFISRDPIGQNDQINLYTYVANSPMNYVDRFGKEKILIMYSPNHSYDQFSTEAFSKVLEEYAIESTKGKKVNIVRVSIDNFDEFKNNLKTFNAESDYSNGKIVYIGHNQGWLSKNVTDDRIGELPTIAGNVSMDLFSCATQIDTSTNYISWSNQIAQKLANQLNIPVTGSSQPVEFLNNSTQYYTPDSAWKTSLPGGTVQDESFSIENVFYSIISNF